MFFIRFKSITLYITWPWQVQWRGLWTRKHNLLVSCKTPIEASTWWTRNQTNSFSRSIGPSSLRVTILNCRFGDGKRCYWGCKWLHLLLFDCSTLSLLRIKRQDFGLLLPVLFNFGKINWLTLYIWNHFYLREWIVTLEETCGVNHIKDIFQDSYFKGWACWKGLC